MPNTTPLNERIIFALDVNSKREAEQWLDRLAPHITFYKVGLQLFLAGWFPIIDMIVDRGHKVMVDLKFFDIPETVGLAVRELKNRGITFLTVHGNDPILRAAVRERDTTKILAVTVLTSFDVSDLQAMGLKGSVEELVYLRAKKALEIGCDGVVSSGLEVPRLRGEFGNKFLIVSPGIRPGSNDTIPVDDQKRTVSAYQAIYHGADHIVVGRPIRDATNPELIITQMQMQITNALAERNSTQISLV